MGQALVRLGLAGVLALTATTALGQGGPLRGAAVYEAQCASCHQLHKASPTGPPLAGVFGRQAGTAPDFRYSPALRRSGIVWDDESLHEFLADPSMMAPGTTMTMALSDPQERDDVVAYLKSLSPSQ
jgi:cytochrome c